MTSDQSESAERRSRNLFSAIFVCMAAVIILAGILHYRRFEAQYRSEAGRGLSSVAELKAAQVAHYRAEHLNDASLFFDNATFSGLVRRYFADSRDLAAKKQIQHLLENMKAMGSYDRVRLLDTRRVTRLSTPVLLPPITPAIAQHAAEIVRAERAGFADFYRDTQDNSIYLSVAVPIIERSHGRRQVGTIILCVAPATHLYPLLQRWPTPSPTAETLLVRRDGDDALFLTPTRFRKDSALRMRIPLSRTDAPAVRAVLGRTGVAEGIDYRGVPVLADTRAIPDSPWFLVTRVDISEVVTPLREHLWLMTAFIVVLLIGAGAALAFIWKQRSEGFYRDRYAVAEALRESSEKTGLLLNSAAEAIYGIDQAGNCTFCNNSCLRLLGYTRPEELLGKNMHWQIHSKRPDGTPFPIEDCRVFQAFLKGEEARVDDEVLWRSDGTSFPAEYWSYPQRRDGAVVGAVISFFDITERRKAEEELRKLSLAIKESPASIVITDADGAIEYVNRRFTEVTGYSFEEVRGRKPSVLKSGEQPPEVYREFWKTISSGEIWRGEFHNRKKNGELYWETVSVSPLKNARGGVTHYVAVKEDITGRKLLETEFVRAKEAAEAANLAKSAFLANMSHEIRTPMNAILGFSQLMRRDPAATPQQKQQINIINRSGEHLLALINDILEMSKAEAGRTTLNPSAFDLHALVNDVEMMLRPRAEAKGLRLAVERSAELPRFVVADEAKLRQILLNLVGNALKFTRKGSVVLRVGAGPGPERDFRLTAEVEDTGPGINPQELAALFRPFEQAQAGRAAGGGTGLGLAISREYARLMGGDITARSRPGEGSVFNFDIDMKETSQSAAAAKAQPRQVKGLQPGQPQYRVLVADDKEDNREFLSQLLAPAGFDIRQAADGAAALKEFEAWRPQLILMDLQMPVLDGYEAMRRVRAGAGGKEVKIIALTASVFGETNRKAIMAGADDLLLKPFRESELFEKIRNLLGAEYVYEEEAPAAISGPAGTGTPKQASLTSLPRELVSRLREAVSNGDFDLLAELSVQVEAYNISLGGMLRGFAEEFDLQGILALLAKEMPHDR